MDAARVPFRREEQRQRSGQGHPGVADTNQNFPRRNKGPGDEDAGRLALFGGGEVRGVLGERELAGPRVFGRRKTSELDRAVAHKLAL